MTVTLLIMGNINHELMTFSLNKTASARTFEKVVTCVDTQLVNDAHHIQLPQHFGMWDYCNTCIKHMNSMITTDHVLLSQYDGMATNPVAWTDEFLEYDYVGSLSHVEHPPVKNSLVVSGFYGDFKRTNWFTCGGGLSLRSKRLLDILANDPQIQTQNWKPGYSTPLISEDLVICLLNKQYLEQAHGIKFAPLELAMRFCAEVHTGYSHAWGFHGWHNAPLYLTEQECLYYFQHLQRSDYVNNTAPMQMCKHHVMMQGYFRLREYLISEGKWLIY